MGEHGQFGARSGARRGRKNSEVGRFPAGDPFLVKAGVLLLIFLAQGFHVEEVHEVVFRVVAQALGVVVDDLVHLAFQLRPDFNQFVNLFLVFGDHKGGVGSADNIEHLFAHRVLIDAHRLCPHRLGSQFGEEPFRTIVADDSHGVFRLETQGMQAQREIFDVVVILLPGNGLPDAVNALAQCHFVGGALGVHGEVLRQRFRHGGLLLHRRQRGRPPVLHPGKPAPRPGSCEFRRAFLRQSSDRS